MFQAVGLSDLLSALSINITLNVRNRCDIFCERVSQYDAWHCTDVFFRFLFFSFMYNRLIERKRTVSLKKYA